MAEHRTEDEKAPADKAALVLDVARVGELEQAIAATGTSLATLMERAGRAVADEVRLRRPEPCSVVVLAGSGNNGGDGWVATEELARAGYQVTLASMKPAGAIRAEPARSAAEAVIERTRREGFSLTVLEEPSPSELDAALAGAGVVVDALLGTGFSGSELRSPMGEWVDRANEARLHGAIVVAADVPSGLSAQTGAAATPCVQADATVTMLTLKLGLLVPEARTYVGDLSCAPLGVEVARDFPAFTIDAKWEALAR